MSELNDWRGKTCGECGWAYSYPRNHDEDVPFWFVCRNTAWQGDGGEHRVSIPACPAFVPRANTEGEAE